MVPALKHGGTGCLEVGLVLTPAYGTLLVSRVYSITSLGGPIPELAEQERLSAIPKDEQKEASAKGVS